MREGDEVTPTIRLVQSLGSGAMGSVWLADHLALGTQVAVKLMMPAYAEDAEFIERFQQEARAAARIRSPHVVQMLDAGITANGTQYIVMELLEGETLGSRLERIGPLPLGDVVRIVVHTANALSRAHQLGIVHRDIKPDNLFLIDVGGEPFVKVLDFGVAKQPPGALRVETNPSAMMGTPPYMSPEQLVSAKYVDHRADVWALAAVAYEALTGRQPFLGESIGAQVLAVHNGGFLRPSALRPTLPAAVDDWATQALQKHIDSRFGSARELADALEQAVRQGPAAGLLQVGAYQGATANTASSVHQPAPERAADSTTVPRPFVEVLSASQVGVELPIGPFVEPLVHEHDGTLVSRTSTWRSGAGPSAVPELQIRDGVIQLVLGDLIHIGAEAIVNSTDRALSNRDGLGAAIALAAGPELTEELSDIGGCAEGLAVISGAGRLSSPTRFIIHAVSPTYRPERDAECAALLRSAYLEGLRVAEDNDIHDVAFPALSTGSSGYPLDPAAAIAVDAAIEHLARRARSVRQIVFVLSSPAHWSAFTTALGERAPSFDTTTGD